jgi:hypothetical protein
MLWPSKVSKYFADWSVDFHALVNNGHCRKGSCRTEFKGFERKRQDGKNKGREEERDIGI